MQVKRNRYALGSVVAFAVFAWASVASAAVAPVTGWMVHNGTATVGGTASDPTFTPGDNITVMAPFDDVTLANVGDFVTGTTTLSFDGRTANTATNNLNTQLRFGLFSSTNATLTAGDAPNLGFIIEYTNESPVDPANRRLIREQTNTIQTAPFVSPTNIGNGTADVGNDSIQGANPGLVTFTLTLTRSSATTIDLTGTISGTDSLSLNPYIGNYSLSNIAATNFTFNRIGLFLGGNADAPVASLSDSSITTEPEPTGLAFAACLIGGLAVRRRRIGSGSTVSHN
jgi:hypothetical protein